MYTEFNSRDIASKFLHRHYIKASLWLIAGFLLFTLAWLMNSSDSTSVNLNIQISHMLDS